MVSISKIGRGCNLPGLYSSFRAIGTSSVNRESTDAGWLSKVFVRKIEASKESHSRQLSDKEVIYALYTHNIRADSMGKYLNNYKQTVDLIQSKKELNLDLVGSWSVSVGDLDQCLHLYKYTGGFERIDNANRVLKHDPDYRRLADERGGLVRARHLQYLLAFSYWPLIQNRDGGHIYEIRSYKLKPGTMIEWGNNWAKVINARSNEAYAGFFSQIGRLYNVHHIWCYKDLQTRKETREAAWQVPGWDQCVAYTVPLIRDMHSRILEPTEFSPTQ